LSKIRICAGKSLSANWYRYCTTCRNFFCNSSTNHLSIRRDQHLAANISSVC